MGKFILTIDDSEVIKISLETLLTQNGYETAHAYDGVEGLEKVKELIDNDVKISMIICDVNMPNMDGLTFVKELKKNEKYKFIPIMMLTTESQISLMQNAKKSGATGWIVKPFQPENVLNFLRKFAK
jgi:two-component system, chemotaxis family, chemotaxis protein CheY